MKSEKSNMIPCSLNQAQQVLYVPGGLEADGGVGFGSVSLFCDRDKHLSWPVWRVVKRMWVEVGFIASLLMLEGLLMRFIPLHLPVVD